jgi:hypothetical protein
MNTDEHVLSLMHHEGLSKRQAIEVAKETAQNYEDWDADNDNHELVLFEWKLRRDGTSVDPFES